LKNKNTNWIIRQGIKKLLEEQQEELKSLIMEVETPYSPA